ncbi:hypothetical protein [Chitinimonas lacunae]|uniref:Bacterial transcriptional activator domain-containing protein n=1 Tax=Chitinimonas lacunae TaxID=1963018 RepID=A0ABV8MN87_9NEIS
MNDSLHTPLTVELAAPQSVAGRRAPYQSLWLLVRLVYAQRYDSAPGWVRLAELRQQFTDAQSLRMCISRAFRDFARWGVRVGWGEETGRDPRFLNLDRRSQGPFWLAPGQAIDCRVEGQPASRNELAEFLGLGGVSAPAADQPPLNDFDYWLALASAHQDLRQDRLLAPLDTSQGSRGALAAYKRAGEQAADGWQQALAALGEAAVWRRLDDLGSARQALVQLRRAVRVGASADHGYLDAMEQILTAWCAYSQRDLDLASAVLDGLTQTEPRASVVRYHPRVRFEWANLDALIERSRALSGQGPDLALRRRRAHHALAQFSAALAAAFELGSLDAAQQVAANIGMARWLFGGAGLLEMAPAQLEAEALRWLVLSEWLCRAAGVRQQSAWNAIYLLRIARRAGAPTGLDRAALSPADVARRCGNWPGIDAATLLPESWTLLTTGLLADLDAGRCRFSLLQRCGLYFEHAWFSQHEQAPVAAEAVLLRLEQEIKGLPASDRVFFQDAMATLQQPSNDLR